MKTSTSLPWVLVVSILKFRLTQSAIVDSVLLFAADCKVLHLSVFDFVRHSQAGKFELYLSMSWCGYWSKWTLPVCVTVYSHVHLFFIVVLLAVFLMLHPLFSAISATFFHSSSFTSGVMDCCAILLIMCLKAALLCNLISSIVMTSSITMNERLFDEGRGRLACEYYVNPLTWPSYF